MSGAYRAVTAQHRQGRWRKLHDEVYRAACDLFVETDFMSTSYDAIADRAGVARKTVFNHYPRKRDFIAEWGIQRRSYVEDTLKQRKPPESFESIVRAYFDALADLSGNQRVLTIRMLMGWRETGGPFDDDPHSLVAVFSGLATQAIERGELRPGAANARISVVLYSSYFGVLYDWAEGTEDRPPFDLHEAYAHMLDGLFTGFLVGAATGT